MCFMCKSDGTLGEPVTGSIRLVAEAAGTSRRVVTVDARAAMVCVALVNRITAAEGDAAISVPETDGTTLLTVLDYCKRRVAAAAEDGGLQKLALAYTQQLAPRADAAVVKLARAAISLGARPLLECACRALAARRLHAAHADALEEALSSQIAPVVSEWLNGAESRAAAGSRVGRTDAAEKRARDDAGDDDCGLFSPSDILTRID